MKWIIHTEQLEILLHDYSVNDKNIASPLDTHCVSSHSHASPFTLHPQMEVTIIPPSVLIIPQFVFVNLHLCMKIQIMGFDLENGIAAQTYLCPC